MKKKSSSRMESENVLVDFVTLSRVAAGIVLERLYRQDLVSLTAEFPLEHNPERFLVTSAKRVDAYLIIWKEWPSLLKLADLKGHLKDLAETYFRLKPESELPLYLHLVTNDLPSTNKIRGCSGPGFHLAAFLSNEWKRAPEEEDFGEWEQVWGQVEKATGLSGLDFVEFVRHCRFDLNYPLPEFDPEQGSEQPFNRVELIRSALFKSEGEKLQYSAEEIEILANKQAELEEEQDDGEAVDEAFAEIAEGEPEDVDTEAVDEAVDEAFDEVAESEPEDDGEELVPQEEAGFLDSQESETDDSPETELENVSSDLEEVVDEKKDDSAGEADETPDSELDFAPDVKSVKDVRPSENTELARLNNFDKIIHLSRKHEGRDTASDKVLEDAFDWYFNNANELFQNERFEEAERDYRNALEKLVQLDSPRTEEEAQLLENLGEIYILLKRPDLAVELYERTEELRVTAKIPIAKYVSALLTTGGDYEERGFVFDAEPYYRKAVEVAGNYLEVHDPLVKRANEACMRATREKTSLVSRFSPGELERLKAGEDSEKAIMHRKPKIAKREEASAPKKDFWITQENLNKPPAVNRPSNLKWWLLSIIPISILSFVTVFHFPKISGTVPAKSDGGSTFTSVDGRKSIVLTGDGQLKLVQDGANTIGSYKIVGDSTQDILSLLVGHLRRSNTFFSFEEDDVIKAAGVKCYAKGAPERELSEYMWRYGKLAQLYRNETRKYPDDMRALTESKSQTTYINPFTKKQEEAYITYAHGSNDVGLAHRIGEGASWKGQMEARPGAIVCNNFEGSRFFIRAYDRNGHFLTSAKPGVFFYIELSYGDNVTQDRLKDLERKATHETNRENVRFVLVRGERDLGKLLNFLDAIVPTVLAIFGVVSAMIWRYRVKKGLPGFKVASVFILAVVLAIGWYLMAFANA